MWMARGEARCICRRAVRHGSGEPIRWSRVPVLGCGFVLQPGGAVLAGHIACCVWLGGIPALDRCSPSLRATGEATHKLMKWAEASLRTAAGPRRRL